MYVSPLERKYLIQFLIEEKQKEQEALAEVKQETDARNKSRRQ